MIFDPILRSTYQLKYVLILSFVAPLLGCSSSLSTTAFTATAIQSDLASYCSIVKAVQTSNLVLNRTQVAALSTLALACPPNPAPTSSSTILQGALEAYEILSPLLSSQR